MQEVSARVLFKGICPAVSEKITITSVVTDSRQVCEGCLFVAIKGERVDGHSFAAAAYENGAALVMGERAVQGVPPDRMIVVPDILDAMICLGGNYRSLFSPVVLGVTGSVGKTTTKEFCAAVFSAFGQTLKTIGNQNNEIGLPKTLFCMDEGTHYAVVEMGMQGLGEIRKLTLAARPDAAIITKIGRAHIEQLGSVENVLRAKMEIAEGVKQGGALVLNGDDAMLCGAKIPGHVRPVYAGIQNSECEVLAQNIVSCDGGMKFEIMDKQFGEVQAFIPTLGRHNVQNALLAYTAATRLGLNAQKAAKALSEFLPPQNRQQLAQVGGVTLIEDYYNAGPDSMQAALNMLGEMQVKGERIAVLGDMLELGDVAQKAHSEMGECVANAGVSLLLTVGELAKNIAQAAAEQGTEVHCFEHNTQAAEFLCGRAKSGDVVLLKASRGMKFEQIAEGFTQRFGEAQV